MYLTWALKRARFCESETMHGIPMWKAKPAPVKGLKSSVIFSSMSDAASIRRFGGSNAEAGWSRWRDALLRKLALLFLRSCRDTLTGGRTLAGDDERARSEPSDPTRRMIGSMIWDDWGVRASGGSSVELEGERTEGLLIVFGMDGGGWRGRIGDLLVKDGVDVVRKRAAVAEDRGLGEAGRMFGEGDSLNGLRGVGRLDDEGN